MTDHFRTTKVAVDVHADELGEFTSRTGIAVLQLDDRIADHGHILSGKLIEFCGDIVWVNEIRQRAECGTAGEQHR